MTVTLQKGGNLPLTATGVQRVRVEFGWTAPAGGLEIDGVVTVARGGRSREVLLTQESPNPAEGAAPPVAPTSPGAAVAEALVVSLTAIPAAVTVVGVGAAIHGVPGHGQTFRAVGAAHIRLIDDATGTEVARFDVEPETGQEQALVFGELYRHSSGWKFRAVGQGYANGLAGLADGGELTAASPADVAGFLTRVSAARSRRRAADLLRPPRPAGPPPTPPRSVAPPVPARSSLDLGGETYRPPAAVPPRPPVAASSRPAGGPSSLDLDAPTYRAPVSAGGARDLGVAPSPPAGRGPAAPAGGSALDLDAGPADGRGAPGLVFGERSSRARQRAERVTMLDDDHAATAWTAAKRGGTGSLTVTLRWTRLTTNSGLPRPSDLQLGCFWQALDGSAGLLQTVGGATTAPGGAGSRQVLALAPRDEAEGQKLFVDLRALATFKRFFVVAYGLHGAPEWSQLRPLVTVSARTGESLDIRLGEAPAGARTCVVVSFHVAQDDLVIRRENDFLGGSQAEAAERYGWALDWNREGTALR
jgi:stress response protein SCP2/uncharacterized protein involved in tellurium resistance